MGLDKSSGSHVKGDTYKEDVLEVGYVKKNSGFIILHQI